MNEERSILESLEWHLISSGENFFDELEHRIFINGSTKNIKIGFGHDIRRRETILITIEDEEPKDPKLTALEGGIIEVDI